MLNLTTFQKLQGVHEMEAIVQLQLLAQNKAPFTVQMGSNDSGFVLENRLNELHSVITEVINATRALGQAQVMICYNSGHKEAFQALKDGLDFMKTEGEMLFFDLLGVSHGFMRVDIKRKAGK